MSYLHNDLPAPGRVSLTRVFAARLGHARRKGRSFVPQGCDHQGRQEPTIPHIVDRLREEYDEGEPLTWRESIRFWATTAAPAVVMGLVFFIALWATQP